jgi:hypothetical protein
LLTLRLLTILTSRDSDIGQESDADSFPPARYVGCVLDQP